MQGSLYAALHHSPTILVSAPQMYDAIIQAYDTADQKCVLYQTSGGGAALSWLSPLCHDHASNTFVLYTDNSRETLRYEVFVAEILNYTCGAKDILTFGVHAILWMPALRRH